MSGAKKSRKITFGVNVLIAGNVLAKCVQNMDQKTKEIIARAHYYRDRPGSIKLSSIAFLKNCSCDRCQTQAMEMEVIMMNDAKINNSNDKN